VPIVFLSTSLDLIYAEYFPVKGLAVVTPAS
jgi:hypothetical protein